MLPDFSLAKKEIKKRIDQYLEERVRYHSGEVFGNIQHRPIHEGEGLYTEYEDGTTHETEMRQIHSTMDFSKNELMNDPSLRFKKLDEMAKEIAFEQSKLIVDGISEITEKVGNVIKGKGKFSAEDYLSVMRKITIDFNKDGSPRLPSMVVSPEQQKEIEKVIQEVEKSETLNAEYKKIIEQQRSNWHDRESNRKLVG